MTEKRMTKAYESSCYCTNLRRSAGTVTDCYDKAFRDAGVSAAQYYLLINLSRLERANITHWAAHVGLERSTMIRNIRPLQEQGLVEMTEGHGKTFRLTEKGEQTLAVAIPLWEEAQKRMETFLGKEDAAAILRIGVKLQNWTA